LRNIGFIKAIKSKAAIINTKSKYKELHSLSAFSSLKNFSKEFIIKITKSQYKILHSKKSKIKEKSKI